MAALPRLLRLLWVDSAGVLAELLTTALLSVLICLCYHYSDRVSRVVGPTGTTIIVRLSAFLLFLHRRPGLVDRGVRAARKRR